MSSEVVNLQNVTKKFESKTVLTSINLKVHKSENICIVGPNGSGKSTLLRICSGLLKPSQGTVTIFQRSFSSHRDSLAIRQRIGVLLHSNMLYKGLTAFENLVFYAKLLGILNYKDQIASLSDQLNISKFLDLSVNKLSNGIQRKFAFAKSLLNDPDILIIDEPESDLDEMGIKSVMDIFERRITNDKTTIFSSHSSNLASECSSKIFQIRSGELVLK